MEKNVGHFAFLAGVAIALLLGLVNVSATWQSNALLLLVVLGLIVGLLNVKGKETELFLIAAAALMLAGSAEVDKITYLNLGVYLKAILLNIKVFVAPAALVVALKAVWALAKD